MYTRAANMFKIAKNWSGESSPRFLGGLLSPQHLPVEFYIPGRPLWSCKSSHRQFKHWERWAKGGPGFSWC